MFLRPSMERSSAFWPMSMDVAPETHLKASSDESFGLFTMLRWPASFGLSGSGVKAWCSETSAPTVSREVMCTVTSACASVPAMAGGGSPD